MSPTGRARGAECLPEGHPPRPQLPMLAAECVSVQVCRRCRSVLLDVSERLHVGGKGDSGLSLHYGFAWAFPCLTLTAGALGHPKLYRH